MACFVVPAAEAIVTTTVSKILKNKEEKATVVNSTENTISDEQIKVTVSDKLHRLSNFLWGGSALLAFEHLWHGEISPIFPFLTAAKNAEDFSQMLHEMSTVGVTMAVVVTAFWGALMVIEEKVKGKEKETSI